MKKDFGGDEYNTSMTLLKQINRVLKQQLFVESLDVMVGISIESTNKLTK